MASDADTQAVLNRLTAFRNALGVKLAALDQQIADLTTQHGLTATQEDAFIGALNALLDEIEPKVT